MAAIGTKRTSRRSRRMSAFGGKADIAVQGRNAAYDPKRTSASISCCSSEAGFSPLSKHSFEPIRCRLLSLGAGMRRREFLGALGVRGGVAARGARTAGRARAAHRRAPARSRGRCGISGPPRGVPAGAGAIGLDHRPQRADRHPLGHGQCRRNSQTRGGIGRARAGRHPGHGASTVAALLQATRTVPIVFPVVVDPVGCRLRRQPGAAGRQRHRFHGVRIQPGREMAGAAQADRAGRDASGGPSGSRHTPPGPASSPSSRPWRRRSGWRSTRSTCATPARSSAPSRPSRAPRMAA